MKRIEKNNLPEKTCPVCGLTFRWRRKWSREWPNVRYCSARCRKQRYLVKYEDRNAARPVSDVRGA